MARFRETAQASGLLQAWQVEAAEREVRLILDEAASEPVAWDQAVADKLVAQGLLTKFQAREMLVGRRRFRLGQYTVLDELGRGGLGQVFRAEQYYFYGHYYAVQAMWHAGDRYWRRWYPAIRDELISLQLADGSWNDVQVCPEYGTAMACIILQMPNNYLPIFQR